MAKASGPSSSKVFKKIVLVSAVIGYSALVLYLIYYVGLFDLISTLEKVNVLVYALAISSVILSIVFHALVWFKLLNYLSIKISLRRSFSLYWVGIFIDNIIPGGWSGDLFKAYLISKEPNIESGKAFASVVTKNFYETIFNFGNLALGLILLLLNYTFEASILISLGTIMILLTLPLAFLIGVSFRPIATKKIVARIGSVIGWLSKNRFDFKNLEDKIDKLVDNYHDGMKILLKNPKMLTKPMFYSLLAWVFELLTLFLVFVSLGSIVTFDKVIIVRSIAGGIESQGYAFIGYAQIVATAIYTTLGIGQAMAASAALLGGMAVFWLKTIVAYVAFYFVVLVNYTKTNSFVANFLKSKKPEIEHG